ncbi:hypothetical protein [Pararhizobium gei]|uniref:hypothetical protein n=1 Tax=Pararhizobium gei TaxID=1395951 RepID=UPI003D9C76BB
MSANRPAKARFSALLLSALILSGSGSHAAFALSELKQIPGQTQQDGQTEETPEEEAPADRGPMQIPMPDPLVNRQDPDSRDDPQTTVPAAPVEVLSDVSKIPEPVARMRALIVEAAASGDIERLRPLLGKGPTQTQIAENDRDPIEVLKELSGDQDGIEILAILLDVLSTGFVLVDKDTPDAAYVWPYFTEKSLGSLTPPEKVDLFRLVTAGDVAGMEEGGNYNFYRVGITPDGEWKFFIAGD